MTISLDWLRRQFPQLANLASLTKGGQKLVFAAEHPTEGAVVLKLIHPGQSPETTQRELLAVISVQCHRVPQILEQGTLLTQLGNCIWFREQRIMGQTVRECLSTGPFGAHKLLCLGLHILEALVAAEKVEIVHRDVKPDNIICDLQEQFWLLDFGIARHLQLHSLTATADRFGKATLGYAPPEQCRNFKAEIDSRSDLFALGVTLYECATGGNPFRAGAINDLEILRRVETMTLPRLNLSFPSGDDFADLVATMTQKRPYHRPNTAKEALTWMQEICAKASQIA